MKYTLIFIIFAFLSSCDSEVQTTNSGSLVGDIVGSVQLFDSLDYSVNHSGVKVRLEGTSFETNTDQSGKWQLKNVPAGIYTVVFEKTGYALRKDFNFQYIGNGTYYYVDRVLWKRPTVSTGIILRSFEPHPSNDTLLLATFEIAPSSGVGYHTYYSEGVIFISHQENIDEMNSSTYSYVVGGHYVTNDSLNIKVTVYRNALLDAGFLPGDRLYCKSAIMTLRYPGNYVWQNIQSSVDYYINGYFDPATRKYAITGTNTGGTEVKSFILP